MKGEQLHFPAGRVIFEEGSFSEGIYLIDEGLVEIYCCDGQKALILAIMKPGELIGTATMLSGKPRSASARAKTDVDATFYDRDSYKRAIEDVPPMAKAIIKDVIGRLEHVNHRLMESAFELERYKKMIGTSVTHAAQICSLISYLIEAEAKTPFLATRLFCEKCERVLRFRGEYVIDILHILEDAGIVRFKKIQDNDECLIADDLTVFDDFSDFCMMQNTRSTYRALMWIKHLLEIQKENPDMDKWTIKSLNSAFTEKAGKQPQPEILEDLLELRALESVVSGTQQHYITGNLHRLITYFEAINSICNIEKEAFI